jgi:hypothetical protein
VAARILHDALEHIGIPETELTTLTSRDDSVGRPRVHVPSLSIESAESLVRAMGPTLGPEFVQRLNALGPAPISPTGPACREAS